MKVWIATHEEDDRPGRVIGVHVSKDGAKQLCEDDHEEPLEWKPRRWASEGDECSETDSISSYEVAALDLGLERDGDYGRFLAITSLIGEADDQADLIETVRHAFKPAGATS